VEVPVSDNSSSRIIRFSTFEVNLHTGELRHRGQKVKLQEQPFQVLAALLERPGEVITREELRSKLWPADTFVDFDHSLNAAIKRLRDALGESADAPVHIETMRRVSTTLRHMLTEFSEFFHVSWTGLLIHASVGTAGGLGALRTKRSG
jgi:DNA-binding response OmpR family regulator